MNPTAENIDTENWMGKLPSTLHNIPLYSLAIPGSHDSFTYTIDPKNDISPDEPQYSSFPFNLCQCIIKPIIYRWCVTEQRTCTQQLADGIRYFDFRIAPKSVHHSDFRNPNGTQIDQYSVVHALYGGKVETILREISEFLKFHTKEVVLLDFQHLYAMTEVDGKRLSRLILDVFGDLLCPLVGSINFVTLDYLWKQKQQVLVFCDAYKSNPLPYIWPRSSIPNPWPNTANSDTLFSILTKNYNIKRDGCFYVTQAIITPRWWNILCNITHTLKNVANEINPRLMGWLQDKSSGSSGINIVICDFYLSMSINIPKHIIYLNYKQQKSSPSKSSDRN